GRSFSGFSGGLKAPIAAVAAGTCGGSDVVVAAFSAKVKGSAPNSGLFLYDATTDTISDIVVEGDSTPIGGTWKALDGINPGVGIDAFTCTLHVVFRGRAAGVAAGMDTGIFDAAFTLPSLAPLAPTVIAQEGVTLGPAPFPGGTLFADFPKGTSVSASG